MNNNIAYFFLVICFFFGLQTFAFSKFVPFISFSRGDVRVIEGEAVYKFKFSEKKIVPIKWGQSFKTEPGSVMRFELSPTYSFMLFSDAEILFESANKIVLKRGAVRHIQTSYGYTSIIQTPVSELSLNFGDYFLNYDARLLQLETVVIKGGAVIQGLGQEIMATLEPQFKTYFQAENETGVPVFDIMLSGHKIIRGKLAPPIKLTDTQIKQLNEVFYVEKPDYDKLRKLASVAEKPKPGQICSVPFAEFNQCAYVCKNNPAGESKCRIDLPQVSCERKKCNANGIWVEELRMPAQFASFCESPKVLVGPCYGY